MEKVLDKGEKKKKRGCGPAAQTRIRNNTEGLTHADQEEGKRNLVREQ